MTIPLSVFIITKNEETRLEKTILAVKDWVNEVVVVDSGSTDRTIEVAKSLHCKVIHNDWQGYGQQKSFAESQCKNDWILNVDADEVVTEGLKKEIIELFSSKRHTEYYGYRIRITNILPGEKKLHPWAYSFNQTRLYNRTRCGFRKSSVHDCVIIDGIKEYSKEEQKYISQLQERMEHHFMISWTQIIYKWNRYSEMQASDFVSKGKKISWAKAIFMPSLAFFKAYFIRRYFVYGVKGFVFSYLYAFAKFMKYIKIKELQK